MSLASAMRKKIRLLLGICASALILGSIILFSIESYFPFSPYVDTHFSPSFSEHLFSDIKIGTSMHEVEIKLGNPIWKQGCGGCWEEGSYVREDYIVDVPVDRKCDAPCFSNDQYWIFSEDGACRWWDFAWKEFGIDFRDGIVTEKREVWHND